MSDQTHPRQRDIFELSDSERLERVFAGLSSLERQLLVCALAGDHPLVLTALRPPVLRALSKTGGRLTANLRLEMGRMTPSGQSDPTCQSDTVRRLEVHPDVGEKFIAVAMTNGASIPNPSELDGAFRLALAWAYARMGGDVWTF